jgi:predicted MPP superfamily phosphohydrolase
MFRLLAGYLPFVLVNLALDFYILRHGVLAFPGLSPSSRRRGKILFLALMGAIYLGMPLLAWVGWEERSAFFRNIVQTTVLALLAFKVWALPWLLMEDGARGLNGLWRWLRPVPAHGNKEGMSRGAFLSRLGFLVGAVPLLGLGGAAVSGSAYRYRVHRYTLRVKDLPVSFRGKRLVQISDLHTGSLDDADGVRRGIQMIQDLKPDIVVFTGDLVNTQTNEVEPWMEMLKLIKAPLGVYSVLGNHDYGDYKSWPDEEAKARNFEEMLQVHRDLGWQLLRNEAVQIKGENGEALELIGCENWGRRSGFGKRYGNLTQAMEGLSTTAPKILLTHDPSHFDLEVLGKHPSIALTLCGHTHGMQMGIDISGRWRWSPASWVYPHWAGHYELGDQQLYVNRGFGFVGFRGRLGIYPEITCLELA